MNRRFKFVLMRKYVIFLAAICFVFMLIPATRSHAQANQAPVVINVYAQQRPGTRLIDISYDVADADGDSLEITIVVSNNGGQTYAIFPESVTGDVGEGISPGTGKLIVWDVERDRGQIKGESFKVRVIADDGDDTVIIGKDGAEMALIPAGEFEMGDHFYEGWLDELPVHTVYVDAFYMDVYEVTNAQYARFLNSYGGNMDNSGNEFLELDDWSCLIIKNGDTYEPKKGYENHPVVEVSWYGAAAYAQFYGKRLPTEAEWERAARGTFVGEGEYMTYVWGDDWPPPEGAGNFSGYDDGYWETAPVGSFDPNSYGLHDMAGNVVEWCADEYNSDYYIISERNNPKGPGVVITFNKDDFSSVNTERVMRGGGWSYQDWDVLRVAYRYISFFFPPVNALNDVGFRCAGP